MSTVDPVYYRLPQIDLKGGQLKYVRCCLWLRRRESSSMLGDVQAVQHQLAVVLLNEHSGQRRLIRVKVNLRPVSLSGFAVAELLLQLFDTAAQVIRNHLDWHVHGGGW